MNQSSPGFPGLFPCDMELTSILPLSKCSDFLSQSKKSGTCRLIIDYAEGKGDADNWDNSNA